MSASSPALPTLDELLKPGGLTEDALRRFGVAPHYFGLGFIQIKLTPDLRVHFWHPELTATVAEEELHDHRYDFRSHVVHGSTTHQVFEFLRDEKGDHEVVEVSCQEETRTVSPPRCRAGCIREHRRLKNHV